MNIHSAKQYKAILIMLFAMLVLSNYSAFAQKTTIWLVRHAEKSADNPADRDPALSQQGQQRAIVLTKVLADKNVSTIYCTNYKRTIATVTPLANILKLTPVIYNPNDIGAIAQKTLQDNKGKAALIVGHSNTLIPVIKALNCAVPFDELNDNDYDMLFKVLIDENGKATLTISTYGELHHTTVIPAT